MNALKISHLLILLALTFHWQQATAATKWQSHASIKSTALAHLNKFATISNEGRTETRLGKLDSRLRLKSCDLPIEAYTPEGGRSMGNTTVGIRCPGDGGWSIYLSGRIQVFGKVFVALQPIARGTTISKKQIKLVEHELSKLPYGYYQDSGIVSGMIAKRTIPTSSVVTPHMVAAPKLVRRGERVTLVAENGTLKVRMTGKALSDGISGELVRVRADRSNRVIDGTVLSSGVIKVTF